MDAGPGGELATAEEADRLEAILKAFPTTEEEDDALLKGERHRSAPITCTCAQGIMPLCRDAAFLKVERYSSVLV